MNTRTASNIGAAYSPVSTGRSAWALSALFALAALAPGCSGEKLAPAAPVEVKVATAMQQDVPVRREWVGQTLGAEDIEIRARVAGWLLGVHFKEGTELKKGTLLYTIDTNELEQAKAEAKARLAQAQTVMVRAKSDVDRYGPLAEAGAVSKRDLEVAQAEYNAGQQEVAAAQASLHLAEINLGYATITAPIDGLIGISAAREGDFVGRVPNVIILNTISRVDSVHARFSISEQEYLELVRRFRADTTRTAETAAKAELELSLADGSLYPYKGNLSMAQRQVDAATGTLQFEASFPNPDRILRPGQFARVRATVDQRKGAIVIPTRAIIDLQGQSLVYTVGADNKAQMKKVRLGPKLDQYTVIEEGIAAGDKVVVEGLQRVRPDAPVNATDWTPTDSTGPGL